MGETMMERTIRTKGLAAACNQTWEASSARRAPFDFACTGYGGRPASEDPSYSARYPHSRVIDPGNATRATVVDVRSFPECS